LKQFKRLNHMFKVSPFRVDTFMQSITPLIHCSVNNQSDATLQSFFQTIFDVINVLVVSILCSSHFTFSLKFSH